MTNLGVLSDHFRGENVTSIWVIKRPLGRSWAMEFAQLHLFYLPPTGILLCFRTLPLLTRSKRSNNDSIDRFSWTVNPIAGRVGIDGVGIGKPIPSGWDGRNDGNFCHPKMPLALVYFSKKCMTANPLMPTTVIFVGVSSISEIWKITHVSVTRNGLFDTFVS